MATTSITIRMDEDLKREAASLFNEMGMDMTTAFTIFAKTAVRQRKIPFEISVDPFYSESNMKKLYHSIQEAEEGKFVKKTMDELFDMEK